MSALNCHRVCMLKQGTRNLRSNFGPILKNTDRQVCARNARSCILLIYIMGLVVMSWFVVYSSSTFLHIVMESTLN